MTTSQPPSLGERARLVLDNALEARGLTLADLAARAGLPLSVVRALWADPGRMGTGDFAVLCLALDLDPWDAWDRLGGPFGGQPADDL